MARAHNTYQFPAVMGYLLLLLLALFLVGCTGTVEKKGETTTVRVKPSEVATVVVTAPRATVEECTTGTDTTLTREELLSYATSLDGETSRVSSVSSNGCFHGNRSSETAALRDGVDLGDPVSDGGLDSLPLRLIRILKWVSSNW